MRILKFRAYDKVSEEVFEVISIDFERDFVVLKSEHGAFCTCLREVELMQSTGLKDKNGREIFEGDIIDVGTKTAFIHRVEIDRNNATFILIPVDTRWSASYMYSREDKSKYEVLGNIYENPELLVV